MQGNQLVTIGKGGVIELQLEHCRRFIKGARPHGCRDRTGIEIDGEHRGETQFAGPLLGADSTLGDNLYAVVRLQHQRVR